MDAKLLTFVGGGGSGFVANRGLVELGVSCAVGLCCAGSLWRVDGGAVGDRRGGATGPDLDDIDDLLIVAGGAVVARLTISVADFGDEVYI